MNVPQISNRSLKITLKNNWSANYFLHFFLAAAMGTEICTGKFIYLSGQGHIHSSSIFREEGCVSALTVLHWYVLPVIYHRYIAVLWFVLVFTS